MMRLIYLAVLFVIAGAVVILLATYVIESKAVQNIGTVVAIFGFLLYVVGRTRYRRATKSSARSNRL